MEDILSSSLTMKVVITCCGNRGNKSSVTLENTENLGVSGQKGESEWKEVVSVARLIGVQGELRL